jgi:hypothetical protein
MLPDGYVMQFGLANRQPPEFYSGVTSPSSPVNLGSDTVWCGVRRFKSNRHRSF